ncbi:FAD-binding and (Fe-S)-binding domain-containing protein [uncultured Roseobacter sp.]|uniref:FAD-binding and (Fe-S)-binding domain-containing protein n=1 Tax=uncultured Roseobacter sp. TaxID=114847 RepID=UPI00262E952D|nr:FAD-binding and (Fe-S)-binding domain-containing protein [uncultured Roseobacter sp.]
MSSLKAFIDTLRRDGFGGDIGDDLATRLVGATDNSIYRVEPDAILYPRTAEDIAVIAQLAQTHEIALTARGGGTGTNGQSLNQGVIVDCSRHMTDIVSFDQDKLEAVVQPGVVLDQLNSFLAQHGCFFPPTVSTSSRATIGGMFATDASGKGSRRYGRTSDWVLDADLVLADGNATTARGFAENGQLETLLQDHATQINAAFPPLNRGLTGYNLGEALTDDGLNPIKLLAGSEGTLALTTQITLRVERVPGHKGLTVLAYRDALSAMDHVPALIAADPVAIEFLDDKIIELAAKTPMWSELKDVFGAFGEARGFLFVEFAADNLTEITTGRATLAEILKDAPESFVGQQDADDAAQMAALWSMRKRSVGLLGALEGQRIGVPFVEDAAVPPENLSAFVRGFRTILDKAGVDYGMFGHADVGCVHVRPTLDMLSAEDQAKIREISDAVFVLARDMGGLIFGEHGKGLRGEYLAAHLPSDLLAVMEQIKTAYDPEGRLNPGKLYAPRGEVNRLDEVPFRGARDAEIDRARFAPFAKSIGCNGNGACFNWAPDDPMCPSYKATGEKRLSPKGRATLLREWTHAESTGGDREAIGQAVLNSLNDCLSCRSCTSQCPVAVDIPEMKSDFLAQWYRNKRRPVRDHLVRRMERLSMAAYRVPHLSNLAMQNPVSGYLSEHVFGLSTLPAFATPSIEASLQSRGVDIVGRTAAATADVVLLVDSFTGLFDTEPLLSAADLLRTTGFTVQATEVLPTGKAAHVRGYLEDFEKVQENTNERLDQLTANGAPLISVEPAVHNLLLKDHGRKDVLSLDQFLDGHLSEMNRAQPPTGDYRLFLHCTEKTADPQTGPRWQRIFAGLGLSLEIVKTGCCGMAGLFGHETEHQQMSKDIFDLSWRDALQDKAGKAMATGFSCRSQAKRFAGIKLPHPARILADHLQGA